MLGEGRANQERACREHPADERHVSNWHHDEQCARDEFAHVFHGSGSCPLSFAS
jgi:hypothetical protein